MPIFVAALNKLTIKSYSYSHIVNYAITKYLSAAQPEVINNPQIDTAFPIFDQINAPVDYYFLFDLVDRHKKLLSYLKRLLIFDQMQ